MNTNSSLYLEAVPMSLTTSLTEDPALIAGLGAVLAAFLYALFDAWRDERRRRAGREVRSTLASMAGTIGLLWVLCAACLAAWLASGRTTDMLGLGLGEGWRAITAWMLAIAGATWLLMDALKSISTPERRATLAEQIHKAGGLGHFDLRSPREAAAFQAMAVTAGLTEEIIFRGFVMLTLALVAPFWAAALAGAVIFILFHAYQGVAGMTRIIPITVVLTGLVVLGETLWPAILVHIVVDMVGGIVLWGARVEIAAQRAAVR
jgi:membrane protease YdiL (CAAX protease family)